MGRHRLTLENGDFRNGRLTQRGTMQIGTGRPNDERRFIHKKLLGIGASLAGNIPGIGTALGVARGVVGAVQRLRGGGPRIPARATVPRAQTARVSRFSEREKQQGQRVKFADTVPMFFASGGAPPALAAPAGPCPDPRLVRAPDGHCVAPGSGHHITHFGGGGDGAALPLGEPVMGRYGAGVVPGSLMIDRAVCGKGMQLGDDGVCYNKSQISNKQRMWPRGTRPLMTGGEMRAIRIASGAGRRLDKKAAQLRAMGMMKPLPKAKAKVCPPARVAAPGTTIVQN